MARVFISHASKDRKWAGQLCQWLDAEGHEVFLDQDVRDGIVVGDGWDQRLHERLRWADAVVCVVTPAYVASTWCSAEVGIAMSRGSRLLPVRARPKAVHPLLTAAQYADLTEDPTRARAALVEALRRVDAAGGSGWPDDRSPFPGLRPFDVEQHRVFFGRRADTEELAELLRSPAEQAKAAVLLVVGPSGCGKSSLVRAGLLHVMADEPGWQTLPPIVPGTDPVAALARELTAAGQRSGLGWTLDYVHDQLTKSGLRRLTDALLLTNPGCPGRHVLIVVDQFEELLTQTGPTERARFAELLRPALGGPVQVVATLRPEFFDQLLGDSVLATLARTVYPLRPLPREGLREVVEGPARLAGIGVDDELVVRLVTDTDSGEALPLLAFTLAQLAKGVGRGDRLSATRYEELGTVQGALTRQADTALAEASATTGRDRTEVIAGLLRLVTVDEQDRPTRWRVSRDELPEPVTRELDVFVTHRLVTTDTDSDDNGRVVMTVAHEKFLTTWTPLSQAIKENVSALRARRAVEQAAAEWVNEGRSSARLWERGQLATALADTGAHLHAGDLVTDRVELNATARDFLKTSIRRDRLRRGRAITVLSVLLVIAVVAAGFAVFQQRTAVEQRDIAVSQRVAGQTPGLRAINSALAAQLGLAAYRLVPTTEARGSVLSTFATSYSTQLIEHTGTVHSVAFSSDGRTLGTASGDHTVQLWEVRSPRPPRKLSTVTGHTGAVHSVAFSPDGRTLATASEDKTVRLWDVSDSIHPRLLSALPNYVSTVFSVAFSPDGNSLATASEDTTARLWDVHDPHHPEPLSVLPGHTGSVKAVVFSSDRRIMATASEDTTARLWDVSDPRAPRPLRTLSGHTNAVRSVAFSPDGRTLATASEDKTTRLWGIRDPQQPSLLGSLPDAPTVVRSVAFSPDGRTLITGGTEITTRLWDIQDPRVPRQLRSLTGHTNAVYSVAISPDGHTLATASFDRTVRLWDLPGPTVAGHSNTVFAVAFSPDGRTLATASDDTTARLWDVQDPHRHRLLSTLTGHKKEAKGIAFSPDGRTLATASNDTTARLWDVSDLEHPRLLGIVTDDSEIKVVAFSPDGYTLATGNNSNQDKNAARLWDIRDPQRPSPLAFLKVSNTVWSVDFSPNGRILATGSADSTAQLWDISEPRKPRKLNTLPGHNGSIRSIAFSRDGHTLATASESIVRLWEVNDPYQPRLLSSITGHTGRVYSISFSPDRRLLATASYDNIAWLWDIHDLQNPSPLGILTGHINVVFSVAFSPDGHTLATGSADATARLWETSIDKVADRICRTAWPTITPAEWKQYFPELPYQAPCIRELPEP